MNDIAVKPAVMDAAIGKNIYQKMSLITHMIKRVPKNLIVGTGNYQYNAVAEADILSAVKEAELKCGVFSYPHSRTVVDSHSISKEDGKETQFVRIETVYRFVNMDDRDDFVDVIGYGDGVDSNDKAPGKAMTYADKYALMKAYKVETGDELDARPSDELAGHDILKVRQRVQQRITSLVRRGMDEGDVLSALGMNKKQMETMLAQYENLFKFENAVAKL